MSQSHPRPKIPTLANGLGAVDPGSELTHEEVNFGRAMDRYKRSRRRPFPTYAEVLAVAISLGYRRVEPGNTPFERIND